MTKELLDKRLSELKKQRDQLIANVNVSSGQIFELEQLLAQMIQPEKTSATTEKKEPVKLDSVK